MTKDEMIKRIEELEKANEELKIQSSQTMKSRIAKLIEEGIKTIEELSETCQISSKNVSSNLTAIRKELSLNGQTIISQRIDGKTKLAIVELSIFD